MESNVRSLAEKAPAYGGMRTTRSPGSIQGFGSDGEASNYIEPTRPDTAGLAYLAMGDWHRQVQINDRVWYSGTPEPDLFKRPMGPSRLYSCFPFLLFPSGILRATCCAQAWSPTTPIRCCLHALQTPTLTASLTIKSRSFLEKRALGIS